MEWFLIGIVLVLDQLSKYYIQMHAELHDVTVIPHFFYLTYAKNTGAAWSMLSGRQVLLKIVAVAAIAVMFYALAKVPAKARWKRAALALMIAGAAGNLIDRLMLNYVRDFLHFYPFGYDFPIFNVADSALCIGVFILLIVTLKEDAPNE